MGATRESSYVTSILSPQSLHILERHLHASPTPALSSPALSSPQRVPPGGGAHEGRGEGRERVWAGIGASAAQAVAAQRAEEKQEERKYEQRVEEDMFASARLDLDACR